MGLSYPSRIWANDFSATSHKWQHLETCLLCIGLLDDIARLGTEDMQDLIRVTDAGLLDISVKRA